MNPTIAYIKKNEKFFAIAIIVFLFIATRMYWVFSKEFWYDEAFTGIIIRQSWSKMFSFINQDVHPPLYYIILKLWTHATGVNDYGMRSFSVFCNALNILAIYIFLKKFYPKKFLPYVLTLVIAIHPLFILYSTEARMYAMLSLLYFLAFYFFWQAMQDSKKIAPWLFFILFYTLSIYTHYIAFFGIIPFFLYIVSARNRAANTFKLYASSIISFLLFSPWLPIFLQQKNSNPNGLLWLSLPNIASLVNTSAIIAFGSRPATMGIAKVNEFRLLELPEWTMYAVAFIIFLIFAVFLYNYKKNKQLLIFFFFSHIPILLIFAIAKIQHLSIYHDRFFVMLIPFFIIFFFSVVDALLKRKLFIAVVIMYCIAIALIKIPAANSIAPLAGQISELYSDTQIIAIGPNQFVMLKYYLPAAMEKNVRLYNAQNPTNDFTSWIIIQNSDRILTLPQQPENTIIASDNKEFLKVHFPNLEIITINNYYYTKQ